MYVHPKISSAVQPVKRLAGFEKVQLKPGQTMTVGFGEVEEVRRLSAGC